MIGTPMDWLCLAVYLSAFVFYHHSVVTMARRVVNRPTGHLWRDILALTALHLLYFTLCSLLGQGLLRNFLLFWLVLYLENRYLFRFPPVESKFLTLEVALCTLSNILFYYAVFALWMDRPLSYFENVFQPVDLQKIYALALSYFSASLAFRHYAKERNAVPLRRLIRVLGQMRFLLVAMVLLLAYLLFQGVLYSGLDNSPYAKLWSMLACVYISLGYLFSVKYAIRLSYLFYLDEENLSMQQLLYQRIQEESSLRRSADLDELTQVLNRRAGETALQRLQEESTPFVLCMVDLDGLKYVNDHLGHLAGDQYLVTVAQILQRHCRYDRDVVCRYGGDEFLLALVGTSADRALERLEEMAWDIHRKSSPELPMQMSYGTCLWTPGQSFHQTLDTADRRMYEMKDLHRLENPVFLRRG